MTAFVVNVEEAERLNAGQWVQDANGGQWCLFETHVMVHQWMWKAARSHTYVALHGIAYPLVLGDIEEKDGYVCPHRRVQECGQCTRCGQRVGNPEKWRSMTFGAFAITTAPEPKDSGVTACNSELFDQYAERLDDGNGLTSYPDDDPEGSNS